MKKIIATDIDDVCFDHISLWLERYNFSFEDNLLESDITDWDISLFVKPEAKHKIYDFLTPSIYNNQAVVLGSLWGVRELRKNGYRVIFVTSNLFSMGGVKFNWLNENGFGVDKKDYIECGDKSLIDCNFLLDDNYATCLSMDGRGVLYSKAWNLKNDYEYRVNGWFDFIHKLQTGEL
jgi:5'-nucleotidase